MKCRMNNVTSFVHYICKYVIYIIKIVIIKISYRSFEIVFSPKSSTVTYGVGLTYALVVVIC
jgi:hypothetical protein